jgi:hypothetical protein
MQKIYKNKKINYLIINSLLFSLFILMIATLSIIHNLYIKFIKV